MPGRGPAPKATHSRERRTRATIDAKATVLPATGYTGPSPDLPEGDWHPQTRAWWEVWRHSPQAASFLPTDWQYLTATALLVDALWQGDLKAATEVRLREANLGATVTDRMRLRFQLGDPDVGEAAKPAPTARAAATRRRALRSVVDAATA